MKQASKTNHNEKGNLAGIGDGSTVYPFVLR